MPSEVRDVSATIGGGDVGCMALYDNRSKSAAQDAGQLLELVRLSEGRVRRLYDVLTAVFGGDSFS
jgi:hypothetical protein